MPLASRRSRETTNRSQQQHCCLATHIFSSHHHTTASAACTHCGSVRLLATPPAGWQWSNSGATSGGSGMPPASAQGIHRGASHQRSEEWQCTWCCRVLHIACARDCYFILPGRNRRFCQHFWQSSRIIRVWEGQRRELEAWNRTPQV